MPINNRMALSALNVGLEAKDYLLEYGGYTSDNADLSGDANKLESFMTQAKRDLAVRTRGDATEQKWAKRAVDGFMDAHSFLMSSMKINAGTPQWQVTIMCDVFGKMIEAEQEARKNAKSRESDLMEVTDSAAA